MTRRPTRWDMAASAGIFIGAGLACTLGYVAVGVIMVVAWLFTFGSSERGR